MNRLLFLVAFLVSVLTVNAKAYTLFYDCTHKKEINHRIDIYDDEVRLNRKPFEFNKQITYSRLMNIEHTLFMYLEIEDGTKVYYTPKMVAENTYLVIIDGVVYKAKDFKYFD